MNDQALNASDDEARRIDDSFLLRLGQPDSRGCRTWIGRLYWDGYGKFKPSRNLEMRAHRFAWTRVHGPIPQGMFVCHKCDVPACCEVEHLFLGSPKDNTADMIAKGRSRLVPGNPIPTEKVLRGTLNPRAKLTDDAVRGIRSQAATGSSQTQLGKRFGVSPRLVGLVVRRERWVHVA